MPFGFPGKHRVIAMVVQSNYRLPTLKVARAAVIALTITMLDALPAVAVCSNDFLIGEDLRGTIHSAAANQRTESPVGGRNANGPERKVGTVCAIFNELRRCWVPPPSTDARRGMEITVRFAFKRNGEIIAAPRVTYVSNPRYSIRGGRTHRGTLARHAHSSAAGRNPTSRPYRTRPLPHPQ